MKINQISEKYWKANSKKPKMNKPHTGHESPHPGQSRGFVGEGDVVDMATPMPAEFVNWLKTKNLTLGDMKDRVKLRKLRLQYEQETGNKLPEGKSPHKKGTKKYKKHMAAMHAEAKHGNPVAKNMNKFNKPATHKDMKKAMKKGEVKHKGKEIDEVALSPQDLKNKGVDFTNFIRMARNASDPQNQAPRELVNNKEIAFKAYELFQKGVAEEPVEAFIMAKQHMDNMSFESRLEESTPALSPENRKKFRQIYDPNKEAFGILDFLNWAEGRSVCVCVCE